MLPYLVLYYAELNIPGRLIGILTALPPLVSLVGAPLWTGVADATHRHRLVLTLSLLFSIVSILAFMTVTSFWALLFLIVMFAFSISPGNSLADSATMFMLGDETEKYGRVRVGGTFGWAVASLIAGVVIQKAGLISSFYMYSIYMALALLVGLRLVFSRVEGHVSVTRGIKALVSQPRWILFLSMSFIVGIALAVVNTYLLYYMGELGASKSMMGIAMVVATVSEIPILFFSDRLITRFKAYGLFVLGFLFTGIRLLLLAFVNQPESAVALQLLQGFTYPIIWVAGVSYASKNAPVGINATAQGLFGSMIMGFGAAAGNFLGGFLIDAYSSQFMFLAIGAAEIAFLVIFALVEKRLPGQSKSI